MQIAQFVSVCLNMLMLSCEKASALIDKRGVSDLSIGEKWQLRMHTAMCDICSTYEKQSKLLDQILLKNLHGNDPDNVPLVDNIDLKGKIINKLNQQ